MTGSGRDRSRRVVLVETSPRLPGHFPFQSWAALASAERVWARDPDNHPSAGHLDLAEIDLRRLEPARLDLTGRDLLGVGDPDELRLVRALIELSAHGEVVYLLGEDDGDEFTRAVGMEATRAGVDIEFVFHVEPVGAEVLRLAEVERALRHPETGCPWDLEQDHRSLARHLVEETYELLEAIDDGDDDAICEELGDVLLQVVFHAQIAADRRAFDLDDVARGIADKLVHRHPHVFGDVEVADADDVKANWEELKAEEKQREGVFDGVPGALPALQLADKLQSRAEKLGFAWSDLDGPAERIRSELDELAAADDPDAREEEVGDLLGAAVAAARVAGVDAEQALRRSAVRFRRRFETVLELIRERDLQTAELDADAWLELWAAAKDDEDG